MFLPTANVVTVDSLKRGPRVLFIGELHGNEPCGGEAIRMMLSRVSLLRGVADFLFGNPEAARLGKRFTHLDLNRAHDPGIILTDNQRGSYEYRRAKMIRRLIDRRRYSLVVDIHSSSTPNAVPMVICERNGYPFASRLPIEVVISGFDTHEPGGTDYYANHVGRKNGLTVGVCVECGYDQDYDAIIMAQQSILAALQYLEMVERGARRQPVEQKRLSLFKVHKAQSVFVATRQFADLEFIKKGTLLGHDGDRAHYARRDCNILFTDMETRPGGDAYLLAREVES